MVRLAVLLWHVVSIVLAGTALTVIVVTPSLVERGLPLVLAACGAAAALAIPISYLIARRIMSATHIG